LERRKSALRLLSKSAEGTSKATVQKLRGHFIQQNETHCGLDYPNAIWTCNIGMVGIGNSTN